VIRSILLSAHRPEKLIQRTAEFLTTSIYSEKPPFGLAMTSVKPHRTGIIFDRIVFDKYFKNIVLITATKILAPS